MSIDILILIGSSSDEGKMLSATKMLDKAGVNWEMRISSAHRTPERTRYLIEEAEKNGCKVFIGAAGMAAHLAGAIKAHTIKPVIAVPLTSDASPLNGLDALYATVQMPPGMPVKTMAIDGDKNAALSAIEILALNDEDLSIFLRKEREAAAEKVVNDDKKLQQKLANGRKEES